MDQLIYASLSHTLYWYEVGILKVPAIRVEPGKDRKILDENRWEDNICSPCAGGLSTVNAICTKFCGLINSGLARWPLTVSLDVVVENGVTS